MTRLDLRTTGIGSDRFTNWATTTTHNSVFLRMITSQKRIVSIKVDNDDDDDDTDNGVDVDVDVKINLVTGQNRICVRHWLDRSVGRFGQSSCKCLRLYLNAS